MRIVTICQYTGLKDRKRKEIYDGDILNVQFGAEKIVPMVVCFINGSWCIHEWSNYEEYHYLYDYRDDVTIIGNIYDNPELLGGGESRKPALKETLTPLRKFYTQ